MKIYSILGVEIADIPIQDNAVHERELMKSDFIRLEWSQSSLLELPCGSYIEYDGVKYRLLKDYVPEQQSTLQWDYSPEFQHPIMMLGTIPFIHIDGDTSSWKSADKETEWNWAGMAVNLMQEAFVPFLNKFGADNTDIGTGWTAVVDSDLKASETCSFQSMDFMSALTHAAQQFECEWHLDYDNKILYFGHVNIMTEELVFEVGENIDKPTITENKNGFYNAYIAKGSTRNISQVNDKGENIRVNKRLKLNSEKYPDGYIDRRQSPSEPLVVKELIYEDIYPSLDLYVYAPKARTRLLLDEDDEKIIDKYDEYGNPIYKKYSIWYVRLAYKINDGWKDFEVTKDMLLGTLSCQFQGNENSTKYTSPLAGREFELKYHESDYEIPSDPLTGDTGVSIKKGDYEIIYDESNGLIIPTTVDGGMYPRGDETPSEDNNILRLYNIALPNEYVSHAQEELEKQALEDILYWESDRNSYEFNSNPIVFKQDMPKLFIGRDVKYRNGSYELDTRISKIVQKIDYPFEVEITVGNEEIKGTTTTMREQLQMVVSALSNGTGGMSVEQFKKMLSLYGGAKYLSKTGNDTAQGLITFLQGLVSEGKITAKQGVEIGSFVTGFIGGSGARIDKDGNGELESLVIRQFLEVPELRFNRIDVVSGELWNSICFGTIEAVDTKKRIVTLKLQDGELSGIEVGDICRGIFHCLESSNPSADIDEDECGFQQMAGFSTSYFTPTEVYDDGARFKYSLRSGTSVHPQVGMKFAVYGSFTNPARRASAYHTRTYTRYLNAVDTWRISPDKNIYGQQGNLEGLTINEMEMHGYGGYFHNIYMSGVHVEFDRDWLDHNLPKVYSVHLTTYEHTIVTDIEGNPLNGLEELRNVITGESNVMSGDDNVIATRLAVTTTILAHKGTTPLLYSDTMDEGRFIVTLACVGCTAEVDNGVVKVTSIDKESAEHRVDISVNCEGEGVYVQTFNIPVVKQGENGITADLDNEMASIAANDKGEPLVVPFEEIVSHGRMWYGNEPMYLTSAEIAVPGGITVADVTTITDSEGNHNYLPIDSEHKQCTLRITNVDASAADTNEIRISLTGRVKQELNTEYSKTVVFKLNKVRMGENALNYQLLPSVTEIKATADGVLSESYISCGVTASDGKSLTQLSSLDGTGLSMSYVVYYSANSWSSEKSYTINGNLSLSGLGITKDSVRIVFYLKWNGVLIDKEGVPVVANGEDGNAITSIETSWNIGTNNIYSLSSFYYGTWQTNSPAVNYDYPFLWKKTITNFTKASSKTTYECVGKIGDKGVDGTDIEYIFQHRTTEWTNPTAPSSSQTDDYVPTGWDDDPQGVDATYKFEYMCIRRKVKGIWSAFSTPVIWAKWSDDGIDGIDGINGADSVHYEIITDVDTMWIGAGGVNISIRKVVGSTFTTISLASIKSYGLSLRAYIGNTDVSRYIEYTSDSQIWWDTSINVTTGNVLKIQLVNGITSYTQVLAEKSIPCIGYGEQGERGPALRGPQYWDNLPSSYQFYSGAAGEPFLDVVMNSSGNFYLCKKSHIKSAATTSSTRYWSKGSKFDLVATKVVLSEYAWINNLGACAIEMKDSNGNIEFLARDGNVTCNTGTFNNVTVNGTINSGAGKIGGFNLGTKGLTSNEDEAFISFPLTGESFLHLNAPNEAALISARNDGGKACSLSAYGDNSFGLDIMAQAGYNTMALQSYGNANLVARNGEQIKVTGLSVSVHRITSTSDKIKGCDDLVIFDTGSSGSYAMPSASSYPGKVIYVKKLSGSSMTGLTGMFREAGSSSGATTEKFCANGASMMYVSDGSYWNVFFCG